MRITNNTRNTIPSTRSTYYNHVNFVKGGRWLQAHTATPVLNYGPLWITELDGETLLAHSLKQINDTIAAITGGM